MEQCRKLLFGDVGRCMLTVQPNDLIHRNIVQRLRMNAPARTLTKWADDSLERGKPCKFDVIWRLHKQANAQEVRTRPTSNIGNPAGQVYHFLFYQLIDAD